MLVVLFLYIRADRKENGYQFSGVIQSITYSDKGTPAVIIGGKEYFISFPNPDFQKKIELGDSLIKLKGSKIYKLINNKTKEVSVSK